MRASSARSFRICFNANFPETLHQDILDAVGIDFSADTGAAITRSPEFRDRVLRAYEYSCAVCVFDLRLGNVLVAVEAAHIKWHQAGGPDEESNGLALCTLHHKLFDRGVFTLSDKMNVIVSESAHGTRGFQEWVIAFHDKPIRQAQRPTYYPTGSQSNGMLKRSSKVQDGMEPLKAKS